jgi:hypothetical protein
MLQTSLKHEWFMKYRPVSPDPDLPDQEKYGPFGREHSEADAVKADEKMPDIS